jgi:hypothetical protein
VCRRLALAEGLSDELTANVRLGLVPARTAVELARLPRGNQDVVTVVVTQRGLTTHQTGNSALRENRATSRRRKSSGNGDPILASEALRAPAKHDHDEICTSPSCPRWLS